MFRDSPSPPLNTPSPLLGVPLKKVETVWEIVQVLSGSDFHCWSPGPALLGGRVSFRALPMLIICPCKLAHFRAAVASETITLFPNQILFSSFSRCVEPRSRRRHVSAVDTEAISPPMAVFPSVIIIPCPTRYSAKWCVGAGLGAWRTPNLQSKLFPAVMLAALLGRGRGKFELVEEGLRRRACLLFSLPACRSPRRAARCPPSTYFL